MAQDIIHEALPQPTAGLQAIDIFSQVLLYPSREETPFSATHHLVWNPDNFNDLKS